MKSNLKPIGTVSIEELNNLALKDPWQEVVMEFLPFSVIGSPNGFICSQGSAGTSLPTTSMEGWKYVADFYLYRQDGTMVDRDRYLGSVSLDCKLTVLLVSKKQTPYHHLKLNDPPMNSLPAIYQERIKNILEDPAQ